MDTEIQDVPLAANENRAEKRMSDMCQMGGCNKEAVSEFHMGVYETIDVCDYHHTINNLVLAAMWAPVFILMMLAILYIVIL